MPRTLGKYELLERVALGGMAEIFLAKQAGPAGFEKEVAVKCILPQHARDAQFVSMFLDEARLAARLSHPNIVQIYELGQQDGTYFIAMEYVRGITLGDAIDRAHLLGVDIPFHYAARIMADVLAGLDYAHDFTDAGGSPLGLVHRDMSPDNVLVSYNGAVKTIDFGVAKTLDNEVKTDSGVVKGKYLYMSPEQVMGASLDGRSDIFSASIVLYELTTGQRPFGAHAGLMAVSAIVNDPPTPPRQHAPGMPADLERILLHGLEKDPGNRFRKAREMQRELEGFIHGHARYVGDSDIGELIRRLVRGQDQDARWIESRQAEVDHGAGAAKRRVRQPTGTDSTAAVGFESTVAAPLPSPPANLKDAGKLGGVGVASGHLAHMVTAKPNAALLARAAHFRRRRSRKRSVGVLGVAALLLVGAVIALTVTLSRSDPADDTGVVAAAAPTEPGAGAGVVATPSGDADAGPSAEPEALDELATNVVHEIQVGGLHGVAPGAVSTSVGGADATAAEPPATETAAPAGEAPAKPLTMAADGAVTAEPDAAAAGEVGPSTPEVPPVAPVVERSQAAAMRGTGKLIVDSPIPGSVVLIDGNRRGVTPYRENLVEGRYQVEVRAGAVSWGRTVSIQYDGEITLKPAFKPGGLRIEGVPAGVVCSLDGRQLMRAEFEDRVLTVAAGEHTIECDNPALGRRSFKVPVGAGRPAIFELPTPAP